MPGILADYYRVRRVVPALWGRFYFGHIHHKTVHSEPGARVESFGTIAAPDAWHAGHGYSAERSMVSITHHVRQADWLRNPVSILPGATDLGEAVK